jgi:hypothetical protein
MEIIHIPFLWELYPLLNDLIIRVIIPIVFSLPPLIFTWYKKYVLAETYAEISSTIWQLPTGIKVFYGFNFILICIFGLPLIAPIIGLFGGYFLGLMIFGRSEDEPNIKRPKVRLITTLYLPFALFFALIFYLQVGGFFNALIELWKENIDIMYLSALNLADAVIITSLIIFVFELRQKYDYTSEIPPIGPIIAITAFIILEGSLLFFYFSGSNGLSTDTNFVFTVIHISAFLVNLILLFLRWFLQIYQDTETGTSIYAWITIFIFQLVNVASEDIQLISRTGAILLTCGVFIILFYLTYRKVSDSWST